MTITPQSAEQWRKDGQFVEWQGHQIFVRTGGVKALVTRKGEDI